MTQQTPTTQKNDQQALAGAAPSVADDAKALVTDAKHVATGALDQARHSAEDKITSGKDRLVEGIGDIAAALRTTGKGIEPKDKRITGYISSAADTMEDASRYFESKDLGEIVSDVEDFARREPAIFIGGSFAVGLLLSRFLKASSSRAKERAANSGQAGSQGAKATVAGSRQGEAGLASSVGGAQKHASPQPQAGIRVTDRTTGDAKKGSAQGNWARADTDAKATQETGTNGHVSAKGQTSASAPQPASTSDANKTASPTPDNHGKPNERH